MAVVVVVVEENDGGWMTSRGTIRESSKQKNEGKCQSDSDFSVALRLLYQKKCRFAAICDPPSDEHPRTPAMGSGGALIGPEWPLYGIYWEWKEAILVHRTPADVDRGDILG